jgi:hypothetical protein
MNIDILKYKLKPRNKWFSQVSLDAEDQWIGPCQTIEEAFISCLADELVEKVYIGQGRKLSKQEIDEMCVDYAWEVDTKNLIEIREVIK